MIIVPKFTLELRNQLFLTLIAYIPYAFNGVSRSFSAFLLPQLRSSESSLPITNEEETWIGSLTLLTMPIGCLLAGMMMHHLGRRLTLMTMMIPYMAAWIVTACATNVLMLYFETILNGIGAGMTICTVTYVSEISSRDYRGTMLSLEEPLFNVGIVVCNVTVHYFGWQFSAKCFLVISTGSLILLYYSIPESPNWLIIKNRVGQATAVLTTIRNSEVGSKEEIAELQIEYSRSKQTDERTACSVVSKLTASWKPLLFTFGLFCLHHGSGYNILVGYTVIFFDRLKLPLSNAADYAIVYSIESLLVSFVSPLTTVYFDRRHSLALSGCGMGVSLLLVAVYQITYSDVPVDDKPYTIVPLIGLYAYNFFCALGVMMLPYVMIGEVFASDVKEIACGLSGCFGNIIAGLVLKVFPYYLSNYGSVITLCTLATISLLNVPYALYATPETRGKSIEQIQQQYFRTSSSSDKTTSTVVISEQP